MLKQSQEAMEKGKDAGQPVWKRILYILLGLVLGGLSVYYTTSCSPGCNFNFDPETGQIDVSVRPKAINDPKK